jgi:hypothetical protein
MALTGKSLIDASGVTALTSLQDGDLFYAERSGLPGRITYANIRADFATRTFPTFTITSADINGGTIDGAVIGGASAAAGTFTSITGTSAQINSATYSALGLRATDAADTHDITRIVREPTVLQFQTITAAGAFVSTDYSATIGASGASGHLWRVNGSTAMEINGSGFTVAGSAAFSGGISASGQSEMRTILPQADATYNLGDLTFFRRWANGHFVNSPTVTSDRRLKDEIRDLNEAERRAAAKIKPRTFLMDGKRKVGYIAQEIVEAMASEGLDAFEYNLVMDGDYLSVDYDAVNVFRLG